MQPVSSFSPKDFGRMHRDFMEKTIDPIADEAGARSLTDRYSKFTDTLYTHMREDDQVRMLKDNLEEVKATKKGSMKFAEVYDVDGKLAEESAAQAAKSAGGVLNSDSARFLPHTYLPDFEHLTGIKQNPEPGIAVDGVTVESKDGHVSFGVKFEEALAGATAKDVVLAVTDTVALVANRLDGGVADASIPPYYLTISPRDGLIAGDTIISDSGNSGFSDPEHGHLVKDGSAPKLKHGWDGEVYQTMNFKIDKQNDYGDSTVEPTPGTETVRNAWDTGFFKDGSFDFEAGFKSGALEPRTKKEAESERGAKVLFKAIRENTGQSITKMVKDGLLEFAYHKDSNSLGVLRRVDGESEQWLSIVDLDKGQWVGTWAVDDAGDKEWRER